MDNDDNVDFKITEISIICLFISLINFWYPKFVFFADMKNLFLGTRI